MASPGLVTSATNPGPVRGGATVVIEDSLPDTPQPPQAPAPWWRDPWKVGVAALAGALLLTLLMPRRD